MIVEFGNKSLPVHEPFHRSSARERVNFGAVGSGKTYTICDEAIAWCLEQPGIHGMVTRKTIPELRDSTEKDFFNRLPPEIYAAGKTSRSNNHFESFTFPNGSKVIFRSIPDWLEHKSLNLGFIAWDEMSEFDEDTYHGMVMRLRQKDPLPEAVAMGYTDPIRRTGTWGATNPAGHDWVWRLFHPDSPTKRRDAQAFFSTTLDNPYLPPEYIESLLTLPQNYLKRFVLCQFDDFAGLIYENFAWDTHTIEHPRFREIGIERPLVWMAMDPGTENPTAGLWCWVDIENRTLVGIAEYEQPGLAVNQHCAAWRQIEARERMNVRWRVSDPNAITQRDRGSAIQLATQYAKLGYQFSLGASRDGDRIPALAQLIELRRFKLSRNCVKTYEAIKNYQWKDLTPAQRASGENPKEVPLKNNDHLVNCSQWLAGRQAPMVPFANRSRVPKDFNAEIQLAINKQLRNRRRSRGGHSDLGVTV